MTALTNYDNSGNVMVYHTIPGESGNAGEFEHAAMVSLRDALKYNRRPGLTGYPVDDPTAVNVQCPLTVRVPKRDDAGEVIRDGNGNPIYETNRDGSFKREPCGTVVYVPITGDAEAQEVHARFRHAKGDFATLEQARSYVVSEVTKRGHQPRISSSGPPPVD